MILEAVWNLRTAEGVEPVLAASILIVAVGVVGIATKGATDAVFGS